MIRIHLTALALASAAVYAAPAISAGDAATGGMTGGAMTRADAASADGAFLTEAMEGDNSEVSLGALAAKRGASPQVRAYGRVLVQDHSAHRAKIAVLDRAMGLRPTRALSEDGAEARRMMLGLHGAKFDAALKQHMIEDHQQDIAKYEAQVQSAQSSQVRALAQATLPTLHKHLDMAQAL